MLGEKRSIALEREEETDSEPVAEPLGQLVRLLSVFVDGPQERQVVLMDNAVFDDEDVSAGDRNRNAAEPKRSALSAVGAHMGRNDGVADVAARALGCLEQQLDLDGLKARHVAGGNEVVIRWSAMEPHHFPDASLDIAVDRTGWVDLKVPLTFRYVTHNNHVADRLCCIERIYYPVQDDPAAEWETRLGTWWVPTPSHVSPSGQHYGRYR